MLVYIFPQTQSEGHVTHHHNSELQSALDSKLSTLLSWKVVNRYKLDPLMPHEDKNFRGSLVLDFGIWWRHVKTIYSKIWITGLSCQKTRTTCTTFPGVHPAHNALTVSGRHHCKNVAHVFCSSWSGRFHELQAMAEKWCYEARIICLGFWITQTVLNEAKEIISLYSAGYFVEKR